MVDLALVNQRVKELAADQSADIGRRLEREGVRVVRRPRPARRAATVVVELADGGTETIEADAVLVATGAAPAHAADRRSPTASGS